MSSYNQKNTTAYYYCSDTACKARGLIKFSLDAKTEYEKIADEKENFNLTNNHTIAYEEHSYQKYKQIKIDINNKTKSEIKNKLIDLNYLKTFLNTYAVINNDKVNSPYTLLQIFKLEYGDVNIDYNILDETFKKELIEKYKNKHKIKEDIKINDIINLNTIAQSAFIYLRNFREYNKEMDKNLLDIKFNNQNIISKINVSFIRKNIQYTKDIYIIMTDFMRSNIANNHNLQYFMDVTYYATPPNNKKYKLLIILAFNNESFNTLLCNISILCNENKETFISILDYLKTKYKFDPKYITIDYSMAEYNAIKHVFSDAEIIANIKLMSFIPLNAISAFYKDLKKKYKDNQPNFFKYFDKYYMNSKKFSLDIWNYNHIILKNYNNNNIIFYTNNICESFNRTINKKYVGLCKTMYNLK